MSKNSFATKLNILKQFENKKITSDQINVYINKVPIARCAIGTYSKSVKKFIPSIQNKISYYHIAIPYMDSADDMLAYFLKGVLEDTYMCYMANPLDKNKEMVVLSIACYPYIPVIQKNQVVSEFVTLLKKENLLEFLNIQSVCLVKTHLETTGLLFTFSSDYLLCMKHLTWGDILWYNADNENLNVLLNTPDIKFPLMLHLVRVNKDKLRKSLS